MIIVDWLCYHIVMNTPINYCEQLMRRSEIYNWMIGRCGAWSYRQEMRKLAKQNKSVG